MSKSTPAWARGLDMSESCKIAKQTKRSQAELDKLERSKSASASREPYIVSFESGSRGIFVHVSPPGIGFRNAERVANILRKQHAFPAGSVVNPRNVFVAADGAPIAEFRDRLLAALLAANVYVGGDVRGRDKA